MLNFKPCVTSAQPFFSPSENEATVMKDNFN